MKKKWYRSVPVKAALVVIAIVSTVMISLSGSLLIGVQGEGYVTPDNVLQYQSGKYEDSKAFSSRMQEVTVDVLNEITARKILEPENGIYNPKRLVDIMEFEKNTVITGENKSGIAYTLEDIRDWGLEYNNNPSTETTIIVCQKPDQTYDYYYVDDFEAMFRNEGYALIIPEEMKEQTDVYWDKENGLFVDVLSQLKNGMSPKEYYGYSMKIRDPEGNVKYDDFWGFYQGIEEKKAPVGVKNILEAVNQTPELNGKLSEVFGALERTLSRIDNYFAMYEQNNGMWTEGNTNYNYLLVELDKNIVWTNNNEFKNINELKKNLETIKSYGKYVIVKPKLVDFKSNMETSANDWRNVLEYTDGISDDYVFAAAVDTEYPIQDVFYTCQREYGIYSPYLNHAIIVAVISMISLIVALVWLTICAGRSTEDDELHLIPYDHWKTLFGAAAAFLPWLGMTGMLSVAWTGFGYQAIGYADHGNAYYMFTISAIDAIIIGCYAAATMAFFLMGYMSLVRRIKARTVWKNSVTYACLKVFKEFWKHRRISLRAVVVVGMFMFVHWLAILVEAAMPIVLIMLAVDAAAMYFAIRGALEKEHIRQGIKEIATGNVGYKIPTEKMHGDSKEMAEIVNNIGDGLDKAVASAMKSERLKADLITNVSHDIKTPLTSIVNYVDLLKRENFEDPKIQGYLEVLESKAQRLKTLTEDVVEASKVSSGNISLEMMDVNLVEMVNQTIGEMSEKMDAKNLTVVASLPEEPAIVHVDGRRMWRVLENIFNNAAKYAMPGTRVYADLKVIYSEQDLKGIHSAQDLQGMHSEQKSQKKVIFSLKNVSENPLNINAEELTERFIRGDVSRSTEGSGLGLSIARDLTEMQGGKFELYVDGDLFKVMIEF